MKVTNVVILFKSRIGFYDYHAIEKNDVRSVRIAFFEEITANKSVKSHIYSLKR